MNEHIKKEILTFRNKRFAREYLKNGGRKMDAYEKIYGKKNMRTNFYSTRMLHKPQVQRYIESLLDKEGLNESYVAKSYKKILDTGLEAPVLNQMKPADTLNALKEVGKLHDMYPAEKKQIEKKTSKLTLELKGKSREELAGVLESLQQEVVAFSKMLKEVDKIKENKVVQEAEVIPNETPLP